HVERRGAWRVGVLGALGGCRRAALSPVLGPGGTTLPAGRGAPAGGRRALGSPPGAAGRRRTGRRRTGRRALVAHRAPSRTPAARRAPRAQSLAGMTRLPAGTTSPRRTAPPAVPTTTPSGSTTTSPGAGGVPSARAAAARPGEPAGSGTTGPRPS